MGKQSGHSATRTVNVNVGARSTGTSTSERPEQVRKQQQISDAAETVVVGEMRQAEAQRLERVENRQW